jgi:hypothetical protein
VLAIIDLGTEIFLDISNPVDGGFHGVFFGESGTDKGIVIFLGIIDKFIKQHI